MLHKYLVELSIACFLDGISPFAETFGWYFICMAWLSFDCSASEASRDVLELL